MARKDHGHICIAFVFACVVSKNQKTPNLNPMADDAITQGNIRGLGSTVYPGGVLNFELGTDVRPEVSTTTLYQTREDANLLPI